MSSEGQDRAHALGWGGLRSPRMYALIRARVHRGAAVEDVANVSHGDAPFAHPPVAVADRSNLHGIMIRGRDTPKDAPARKWRSGVEGRPGLVAVFYALRWIKKGRISE